MWKNISDLDNPDWDVFIEEIPKWLSLAESLREAGVRGYWKSVPSFPGIRTKKYLQLRLLIGGFGLAIDTGTWKGLPRDERVSPLCNTMPETVCHFLLECRELSDCRGVLWDNLRIVVAENNPTDAYAIVSFIENLDSSCKAPFLLDGLALPFDSRLCLLIDRFIAVAVSKLYRVRLERLNELQQPGGGALGQATDSY